MFDQAESFLINGKGRFKNFGINAVPGLFTPVEHFRQNIYNLKIMIYLKKSSSSILFEMQFCQKSNYLKTKFFQSYSEIWFSVDQGKKYRFRIINAGKFWTFLHNIAINSEKLLNFERYKKNSSTFILLLMKCFLRVLWFVNFVTENVELSGST